MEIKQAIAKILNLDPEEIDYEGNPEENELVVFGPGIDTIVISLENLI